MASFWKYLKKCIIKKFCQTMVFLVQCNTCHYRVETMWKKSLQLQFLSTIFRRGDILFLLWHPVKWMSRQLPASTKRRAIASLSKLCANFAKATILGEVMFRCQQRSKHFPWEKHPNKNVQLSLLSNFNKGNMCQGMHSEWGTNNYTIWKIHVVAKFGK